jgi:hypothetical protein
VQKACRILCLLTLFWPGAGRLLADGDVIDFSDRMTPVCEVVGLSVRPPKGWFNVPIESAEKAISGCQMMRTGKQDELLGIIRVLSVYLPQTETENQPRWYDVLLAVETQMISTMGYVLKDVIWTRLDVPISGSGFENARAIGLAAALQESEVPQETHFLAFENGPQKYVITLLTPAQSVGAGVFYKRNASDYGVVIRSLKERSGGAPDR